MAPPRRTSLTLYAHPFELAIAVLLGVSAVKALHTPGVLAPLTGAYVVAWAVANAVGVVAVLLGVFTSADLTGHHPRRTSLGRAAEKAGLYLLAATSATYAFLLEVKLPFGESWSVDVQLGAVAAACVLRAGAIRKAERIELATLRYRRQTQADTLDRLRHLADEDGDSHG